MSKPSEPVSDMFRVLDNTYHSSRGKAFSGKKQEVCACSLYFVLLLASDARSTSSVLEEDSRNHS